MLSSFINLNVIQLSNTSGAYSSLQPISGSCYCEFAAQLLAADYELATP